MKLRLLILSLLIINSSLLISQDTWVQSYAPFGSSEDKDYSVRNIAVCQDGGYAVNGSFRYEVDEYYVIEYGFLMKTDSNGNYLWAKKDTVTFIEKTESYAFIETDDGGFISSTTNATIGGGNSLIKRDSGGNREWVIDNDEFIVHSMDKTNDGNVILAGRNNGTLGMRKITQNGVEIWTQTYNPNNMRDYGFLDSIIQTSDEGYAATGYDYNNVTFSDIYILKTDGDGDTLWTRTYDGYGDTDLGKCIIEKNDNNYLISGYFQSFRSIETILFQFNNIGNTISIDTLSSSFSSLNLIESSDQYYVGYYWSDALHLCKYDEDENIIWTSELPIYVSARGDRGLEETVDGFVCAGMVYGYGNFLIIKTDLNGQYTDVSDDDVIQYPSLNFQIHPNPFNPIVTINFDIYRTTDINLKIYNSKGQFVKDLINDLVIPGNYQITWNGLDNKGKLVGSGIYFIQLQNERLFNTKKILLVK